MAATGVDVRGLGPLLAGMAALLAACGGGGGPPPAGPAPEAVAIGYGTQPARGVTGAVGSLSNEGPGERRVAHVEELFQGRLAGVQVSRLASGRYAVRIRGAGGFSGGGEPLYVIDGVPVQARTPGTALEGLAPGDVARIDVLKDAGSAAIYGARAANGVILITTRRRR